MVNKGNLYIIAAPSGAGKTTLVNALIDSLPHITISVSHTTRAKRPNETPGLHYHFVSKAEFESMLTHGDFLEHALIFDHHYGTSKNWVEQTLAKGIDVILEIDWQGHQQIKRLFPAVISIFILPPSLHDLEERLMKRNQDHPNMIKKRLADAKEAVSHIHEFDFVIVNDEFSKALHELKTIVEVTRLQQKRQIGRYASLLQDLMRK